ncbi:MAG: glycyl-tRNA synthetase, beta subunit [Myxococcales bacterium]|nr:glycyl-tRNA synthetase, beta subunit [Myxococcales bacterium]
MSGDRADLLFEIGCEEIPAKMLAKALEDLPAALERKLAEARLEWKSVRAVGTPRRLALIVKQLSDRQPDLDEEVVGPPVSAAFGADGAVTKAGQGFAAKNGVEPSTLQKKEVPGKKGMYAVAQRHVAGQPTRALLPDLLRDFASKIPWPKSMHWGWHDMTFVRPVQWLVALFGGEVVPFQWANQQAGRASRGHRFLSPGPIEIASAEKYIETLRAANVVVDQDVRLTEIRGELKRIEGETGLRVRPDEALLAEVIHLGEYPVGVSGGFDPSFLEVPEEMIVTAMRTHQRYFAMEDKAGKLANRFVTLMATIVKDPKVVSKGNEKVLASRLSDAKFFFAEDRKHTFEHWNKKLDGVVFQAKLGDKAKTIGDKVRRITQIVETLCSGSFELHPSAKAAADAARLCKADLASMAVSEFPELQGVMGRHYAKLAGTSDEVANAIEQHYWPKGQGGELPKPGASVCVAIADRIDTLVGCFATGLVPTGSADPLGLRRAAVGVLTIMIDQGSKFPYTISKLIETATHAYMREQALTVTPEHDKALREFFAARLRALLIEEGLPAQDVDAVIGASSDDPYDVKLRAQAVGKVPAAAREVFKRVANILEDATAKKIMIRGLVDPALFAQNGVEQRLWDALARSRNELAKARKDHKYQEAFEVLVRIQPEVAAFFDKGGVMVMDPDPALRENRLSLLRELHKPFSAIADFRLLGGAA